MGTREPPRPSRTHHHRPVARGTMGARQIQKRGRRGANGGEGGGGAKRAAILRGEAIAAIMRGGSAHAATLRRGSTHAVALREEIAHAAVAPIVLHRQGEDSGECVDKERELTVNLRSV
jgi:hypothetical protein